MILYFLRHGLAEDRETWTDDDRNRPLTDKGKKQMAQEAESLASLIGELDLILTSPLIRAMQTAEAVAKQMEIEDKLVIDQRLEPGFDLPALTAILSDYPKAGSLMLVGHEPDFSNTLSGVIGGGALICKKGGLARVEMSSNNPPRGELAWLLPPKVLIK